MQNKNITESIKFVDVNALIYAKKNVKNAFTIVPFCFLSSPILSLNSLSLLTVVRSVCHTWLLYLSLKRYKETGFVECFVVSSVHFENVT